MSFGCVICLDALTSPVSLPCGHIFCEECMKLHMSHNMSSSTGRVTCPTCRTAFTTTMDELNTTLKGAASFPYPTIRKLYLPPISSPQLSRRASSSKSSHHSSGVVALSPPSHESEGYLSLLSRVSRLEAKVAELRREKDRLNNESQQRTLILQNVLVDRQNLKTDNERIRKDLWAWRNKYEMLSTRVREGIIWAKEAESHVGDVRNRRVIPTRPNAFRPQQVRVAADKVKIGMLAWWGIRNQ